MPLQSLRILPICYGMGDPSACRTFRGQSCLLPDSCRDAGTCAVCASVVSWVEAGANYILVREIKHGQGLYVFPVSRSELTPEDGEHCVLQFRIADSSLRDIRETVNTYLLAADESWIFGRDRCTRVR